MDVKQPITKKIILDFLKTHKKELHQFRVRSIGLFGSYVRGEAQQDSDIDMLVEYESGEKTFDNFIGLIDYLEKKLGKEVDLVTRESVSKFLLPYIEKELENVQILN